MQHNNCPHCGAPISLRQRLAFKPGIHCRHCGSVSYSVPGTRFMAGSQLSIYLPVLWTSFYQISDISAWEACILGAADGLFLVALMTLNPLRTERTRSKCETLRMLATAFCMAIVFAILVLELDNLRDAGILTRPPAGEQVCPPRATDTFQQKDTTAHPPHDA